MADASPLGAVTLQDTLRDPARVALVRRLVATSLDSTRLQGITQLAADLLETPFAQVSLLLDDVQVVVALAGAALTPERRTSPVEESLCTRTFRVGGPHAIADAPADATVRDLPPVAEGGVRGYLGVPLLTGSGVLLGALCAYGPAPKRWRDRDADILARLAATVVSELELQAVTAELQRSAARLELALGAASIGSFDLDPATGELTWDTRLMELFGYTPSTFTPHIDSFNQRVHPEDRERVDAHLRDTIENSGELSVEYRIVLPDGRTRWISARGRMVVDESGHNARLLGAAYDSTGVRDARDQVARVLENMTDAFFSLDREWRFTYVNAEAEKLLLRPRSQLLGRNLWEEFPEAVGDTAFWREYHAAMQAHQTRSFEEYYPEPIDGWFEVTAYPTPDGLSVYFHDITGRRRAEIAREAAMAAREESAAQLELVAHRAAEANERLTLLADITKALVSTLDVDEAMARLVRLVVPRLADWASVTLLDEAGELHHSLALHRDSEHAEDMNLWGSLYVRGASEGSLSLQVARSGTPVMRSRYTDDDRALSTADPDLLALLKRIGLSTVMVVPLQGRERTLAVLVLAGGPDRQPYTDDDLAMATELGQRAGLAVDNAQLYARLRTTAEVMQRSLLTELPEPDHVQIVARYLPAAQEAAVGGDWHDAALQPDGATVLSIGDVMGHDIGAAAAMGQIRTLLRGIAFDSQDSPAGVLRRVDAAIKGLAVDTLATAVVARLEQEPEERRFGIRRLRWSNAGHPPPMLLRADGTVHELGGHDLLLGLDPGTARTEQEVVLRPRDTVLFYTDGLVERRESPIEHGLARLRQALTGRAEETLDDLCDGVLARLLPEEPSDDVALIAIRPLPEDQPRPPEAGPNNVPEGFA